MKKYLKQGFYIGLSFILTISIFGFIAYKVFAALTNVNSGDTLTATNWNELITEINNLKTSNTNLQNQINNTKWTTVALNDTSNFDTNCERRFYDLNMKYFNAITPNGIFTARQEGGSNQRIGIKSTEKGNLYPADSSLTLSSSIFRSGTLIQKRCHN